MEERMRNLLDGIKTLSQRAFGDNLVGVYLHGSYVLGCFRWDYSDLDFLVVVNDPPTQAQKEAYISGLLELNKNCPKKGLEMSVVLFKYAKNFVYPTPFELHFSEMHVKRCTEQLSEYCEHMNGEDEDLAAHFTITNHAGVTLCGKPVGEVFGPVPAEDYLASINEDIEWAFDNAEKNPVYAILNPCRVLAFKREGLVLSKKGGGEWGEANLDLEYAPMIRAALDNYLNAKPFDAAQYADTLAGFIKMMRGLFAE